MLYYIYQSEGGAVGMEKQFDLNKVYTEQELASANGAFYKERLEKWKK